MFAILLGRRFDAGFFVRALLWFLLALVVTTHMAVAQTAAPVKVSLTPVWSTVTPYVSAGVLALVAWVIRIGDVFLAQHRMSALQDNFDQALEHVPGLMTQAMASLAAHNPTLAVPAAITTVANAIISMVPGVVTQMRLSPDDVETYVAAKLHAVGHPAVTQNAAPAGAAPAVAKG